MRKKELKMKLGQLQEEISKASSPVCADVSNDFKSIILENNQGKIYPSWGSFWRSSKNIYSLLSIILHITRWTLMLMLHMRQSIYLVLTNVLSTSFLMLHIIFNEISTTLPVNSGKGRCTWYMWSNDMCVRTLESYVCYFLWR